MSRSRSGLVISAGLLAIACCIMWGQLAFGAPATEAQAGPSATARVDFERDIQPIFKSFCYQCHGPDRQKAKLRLDSRPLAMQGGKDGKIILPGDADQSELIRRLTETDENMRMPQDREALPAEQIALIRTWIEQGATWPDRVANVNAKLSKHWSFMPVSDPTPPTVADKSWVRNPIDQFVLAKLESSGLKPAPQASREALIRRVYLDVIGIQPTPAQIDAFLNDSSPNAYEKVVDELLASPHYGERWARHWLDLARYAESEGFKSDETRPYAWRYRDYVIKSLNNDKPYDRFIKEQIAGDELWPTDQDARIATGFIRHYPDESNARNLLQRRQEILNDITDTVGAVFTGLTIECARCHNHKYDDISQADYYKLQAFFANIRAEDAMPLVSKQQLAEYDAKLAIWKEKTKDIREAMAKLEDPPRKAIIKEYVDKYPPEIRAVLASAPERRSPMDWQMYWKASLYLSPDSPQYLAPSSTCFSRLKGEAKAKWEELNKQLKQYADLKPADLPRGMGIIDGSATAPPTFLLRRGVYDSFGPEVQPGFLSAIDDRPPKIEPPADLNSTGRRTALANWLASSDNPLTARVMVNRIWQHHFGEGIVRTPSDFGVQGDPPTHPKLLDWLASEFVRGGWSMKHIHRLILTSATYQQACVATPSDLRLDPEDRMLARYPRSRLEGEIIRDESLESAGLLNLKMGGPSVFPEIPAGVEGHGWKPSSDEAQRDRRSIYVFVRRNVRYPMFETFDMPDTVQTCARRYNTTTPAQALTLMNDRLTLQWAQSLAGRAIETNPANVESQIDAAYRLALCRHPSQSETKTIEQFLNHEQELIDQREKSGDPISLPPNLPAGFEPARAAAMVDFCHVLLNSNEFVYGS